jgi:hypothetical protein
MFSSGGPPAGGGSSHPGLKDSFSAVDMTTEKLVAEVLHNVHTGGGPTSSGGGAASGNGGYLPPGSPRLGMGGMQSFCVYDISSARTLM